MRAEPTAAFPAVTAPCRTFGHAVQDHVDEDVGPGPARAVTGRRREARRGVPARPFATQPPTHAPHPPHPPAAVPAVHNDRAGAAPVALVHLPARTRGAGSAPAWVGPRWEGAPGSGAGLPPPPPSVGREREPPGERRWRGWLRSGPGWAPGTLRAAGTAANDHFCDYATGARLLAANHKNDAGSCETGTETETETDRAQERGGREAPPPPAAATAGSRPPGRAAPTALRPRPAPSRGRHPPAEVEEGPGGGGDALGRPAEEVELRQGAGLLRLHVLQVEAAHQEVLAPDVLRHQVHLPGEGAAPRVSAPSGGPCAAVPRALERGDARRPPPRHGGCGALPAAGPHSPRRCGTARSLRPASSGRTA